MKTSRRVGIMCTTESLTISAGTIIRKVKKRFHFNSMMILKHYSNRTCSDLKVPLNKLTQERLQLHLNIHTPHGYNDQFD